MRLHEHKDFAAFVTDAAAANDLSKQFVEKDNWIPSSSMSPARGYETGTSARNPRP